MKKFIYPLIIFLSLVIAGTSVYSFVATNEKLKDSKKEQSVLTQDLNTLKNKNENKDKEIQKIEKELEQTKKDLEKTTKELKSLNNDYIEQPQTNTDNIVSSNTTSNSIPATEYRVPSEEDQKKMVEIYEKELAEKEAKEKEPQYATFTEDDGHFLRFKMNYGLSDEMFEQLNPGAEIKLGNTYRIK